MPSTEARYFWIPPQHTIFILATTEPHKIPETILSRCQRYDFKKISTTDIKERIEYVSKEESIKIKEDAVSLIANFADGGGLIIKKGEIIKKVKESDIIDILVQEIRMM